jgi:hypothetical protein
MVISFIETARKTLTNLQGLLGNNTELRFSSNCQRGVFIMAKTIAYLRVSTEKQNLD